MKFNFYRSTGHVDVVKRHMMQNKSGLLLIFLGLLMTVVIYFFLQNRYISQSAWIKADVTLDSISSTDPLHSNVEDMSYYGVYYFNINGNYIKLCSAKVSDPKYIDNQMIFYINPNNYNDYHPQYEQNTKYLSLLALLISFIGIIDLLNTKSKRLIDKDTVPTVAIPVMFYVRRK